jgi:uncharacterized protein
MMPPLKPGTYELPEGVLDVRLGIFGQSGYGKTNAAKRGAERLLKKGKRVGIIDPTDSWYGLRKGPDGKRDAFKVIIFGGEYGDLPLNPHAGATVGLALAHAKESWIVSLAEMPDDNDRARFMADFLSALYDNNRAPLHLIVDEADTVAPEKPDSSWAAKCVGRMREIVKRGRKRGFMPWLITQRPADIAKSVTSQVKAVVCLSLTLPHDIDAVKKWVSGQRDKSGQASKLFEQMPELPRGEGLVWWPEGGILARERFAKSKTFDSGKAPEAGDVRVKLKPLKVDKLAKAVEDLIREREENDPGKLKERIAELQRIVDGMNATGQDADANSEELAAQAREEGHAEGYAAGQLAGFDAAMLIVGDAVSQGSRKVASFRERIAHDQPEAKTVPAPQRRDAGRERPRPTEPRPAAKAPKTGNGTDEARLRPGERTILTVLAQAGRELPSFRVAARARMARNGGTFKTYAARLRSLGLMYAGDPIKITGSGLQALGQYERLPTGRALREHWHRELRPGEVKLLEAVAGGATEADAIGRICDMPPSGGTFKTYMARLKSLGLITGDGRKGFSLHEDLR